MRGWVHYLSGVAMATFFPVLLMDIRLGILIPLITGAFGYLPDFIDFKFKKFFCRRDVEIDPAPLDPKTKIAPKTIKIKELGGVEEYQLYALYGIVESVIEKNNDRIVFKLRDDTGSVVVEAIREDYEKLRRAYGEIRPGMKISIPGYKVVEPGGTHRFFVADAPHPQMIAKKIADAIDRAYEEDRMIIIKVYNIRHAGDVYRRFLIHYDSPSRSIKVYMGPLVTTGDIPIKGTEVPEYRRVGEAITKHPFVKLYPRPTVIDAFNGPEIGYRRTRLPNGREVVEEVFIPWHRGWSHSFTGGALAAAILAGLLILIGYPHWLELSIAAMLGWWMHVIEDQLSFMGSVLFPPFQKRRVPGLMVGPNHYTAMNFATAWLMIALIIWNLNRFAPLISKSLTGVAEPKPIPINDWLFLFLLIIPTIIVYAIGVWDGLKFRKLYRQYWRYYAMAELLEDMEEVGGF